MNKPVSNTCAPNAKPSDERVFGPNGECLSVYTTVEMLQLRFGPPCTEEPGRNARRASDCQVVPFPRGHAPPNHSHQSIIISFQLECSAFHFPAKSGARSRRQRSGGLSGTHTQRRHTRARARTNRHTHTQTHTSPSAHGERGRATFVRQGLAAEGGDGLVRVRARGTRTYSIVEPRALREHRPGRGGLV